MDGTVLARCGLTFRPQPQLFGDGPAVLTPPVDLARCCPECVDGQRTHHEDGATVAGLIETLGGGDLR